jgi:hypothetical protein
MTPTSVSLHPGRSLGRCLRDHAPVDVGAWRLCWLLDAGFDEQLAESLAATPTVDLHAVLELVDRGCPPELAARILSPLPRPEGDT